MVTLLIYLLTQTQLFAQLYLLTHTHPPMRPTSSTNHKNKLTPYQYYRTNTKSELNCSLNLISGLNDLDIQMKQYQRLRNQRLSMTETQSPNLKEISNAKIPNPEFSSKINYQQKSQRTFPAKMESIKECQSTRRPTRNISNMTSSCVIPSKSKTVVPKYNLGNGNNGDCKQQQAEKIQTIQNLQLKTKQLQQELLQTFSSDVSKKTIINKQFAIIFKLFE